MRNDAICPANSDEQACSTTNRNVPPPELPESMCLQFNCGVQIQLGFAAEFSNVMIVYTRIIKKPAEITVCKAYVTDFPLVSW